jgi:hypothetical protein
VRWLEGEALRQLNFGLTYRAIAKVIGEVARGERTPESVGMEIPEHVRFPRGYTLTHKRVIDIVQRGLDRFPMLEAASWRKVEIGRL